MCPWLRCQPSCSSRYLSLLVLTIPESRRNSTSCRQPWPMRTPISPPGVPLSDAGDSSPPHFLSLRQTACPQAMLRKTVAWRLPPSSSGPSVDCSRSSSWGSCQCGSSLILNEGSPGRLPPSHRLSFCCPQRLVLQARHGLPLFP